MVVELKETSKDWKVTGPDGKDIRDSLQEGEIFYGTAPVRPKMPDYPSASDIIRNLRNECYEVRSKSLEGYHDPVGHLDWYVAIIVKQTKNH